MITGWCQGPPETRLLRDVRSRVINDPTLDYGPFHRVVLLRSHRCDGTLLGSVFNRASRGDHWPTYQMVLVQID